MITQRGKQVRAAAIVAAIVAVIILIWQGATNFWWVGIDAPSAEFIGWCWGSIYECVLL